MITHVLNGDSLVRQLPVEISPYIVARECFIEGPVANTVEDDFWADRKSYLQDLTIQNKIDYNIDVKAEFEKIKSISESAEICLWFEYDLFCQINMWFVINYILRHLPPIKVSWAKPDHHNWSGFGMMSQSSLKKSFNERIVLSSNDLDSFAIFWSYYQSSKLELIKKSKLLNNPKFPKLKSTVEALLDLHPVFGDNRVVTILKKIKSDFPNAPFATIFQLFSIEAGIYGLGDVQVLKILNDIVGHNFSQS